MSGCINLKKEVSALQFPEIWFDFHMPLNDGTFSEPGEYMILDLVVNRFITEKMLSYYKILLKGQPLKLDYFLD